jgi:hypothetical protein
MQARQETGRIGRRNREEESGGASEREEKSMAIGIVAGRILWLMGRWLGHYEG